MMLELAGAWFRYRGAQSLALHEITLQVSPGEAVAVLGPQEAGASTLCRLAAGLLNERGELGGTVRTPTHAALLGEDPESQLTGLGRTVLDEVALPGRFARLDPAETGMRAHAALGALGIEALAPRPVEELSGGERQQTALAGLLVMRPQLLVLDQPALALDADARARLAAVLRRHREAGGAVLLASHQHDELTALCDRAVVLHEGRIEGTLRPEEMTPARLRRHGVWAPQRSDAQDDDARPTEHRGRDTAPSRSPVCGTSTSGTSSTASAPRNRAVDEAAALGARDFRIVRGSGPSARTILSGVDLTLLRGEAVAVLGPNGAGKSTLLWGLAGLIGVSSGGQARRAARQDGSLRCEGEELIGLPAELRARQLAWVGQDPGAQLSAGSVRTELMGAVPLPAARGRVRRAAVREVRGRKVQEVMDGLGLGTMAGEHPYDLPPSRRKDIVIASALLMEAPVLLLDEPTLGRDAEGMDRLTALLTRHTRHGGSVLLVTHDLAWARQSTARQLLLEDGRLTPLPG